MALKNFLEHIRDAAPLVFPEFWLDPTQEPVADTGWAASLADVWLVPALVDDFSATDFRFLTPDQQAALADAVKTLDRALRGNDRPDPTAVTFLLPLLIGEPKAR